MRGFVRFPGITGYALQGLGLRVLRVFARS